MTIQFVVEDGSSKTDSTSYVSVEDFLQFWENFGVDLSAEDTTTVQAALNVATNFIDTNFEFMGVVTDFDQSLKFPRSNILKWDRSEYYKFDEIPKELKWSICYLAQKEIEGDNIIDEIRSELQSERIGPVSKTYRDQPYSKKYAKVLQYISHLVVSGQKRVRA